MRSVGDLGDWLRGLAADVAELDDHRQQREIDDVSAGHPSPEWAPEWRLGPVAVGLRGRVLAEVDDSLCELDLEVRWEAREASEAVRLVCAEAKLPLKGLPLLSLVPEVEEEADDAEPAQT